MWRSVQGKLPFYLKNFEREWHIFLQYSWTINKLKIRRFANSFGATRMFQDVIHIHLSVELEYFKIYRL